jgi:hypothetical protein
MSSMSTNLGKEKIKIYEAVFSSPGMSEKCKISLHLSRQTIFLLSRLIEDGLHTESNNSDDLISLLPKESLEESNTVVAELLKRSGLTDFYEKLKSL